MLLTGANVLMLVRQAKPITAMQIHNTGGMNDSFPASFSCNPRVLAHCQVGIV